MIKNRGISTLLDEVSMLKVVLFLIFLTLNLQVLTIFGLQFEETSQFKISHLLIVIFFTFHLVTKRFTLKIIDKTALIFYIYSITISVFAYVFHQTFSLIIINYVFAVIIVCLSFQFHSLMSNEIIKSLQSAFLFVLFIVLIKNIIYAQNFIQFFKSPWGHPDLPWLYGGGPNLESTWISIGSIIFINRKKLYYFILGISIFLSAIYASRVGFVLSFAGLFFYLKSKYSSRKELFKILIITSFVIISLVIVFFDEIKSILFIFDRFSSLGSSSDGGTVGRLNMWVGIYPAIVDNYFLGYGAGNSIFAILKYIPGTWGEDNLHLYYVQNIVEFGIIGALLYCFIVFWFIYKHWNSNGILKYCFYLYILGCFIQFRGAEPITWLLYGLSFIELKQEKEKIVEKYKLKIQ